MKVRSNLAVSEDGFVFDPKTGESYTVNEVGISVLQHLSRGTQIDALVDALEKEYDADRYTLEKTVGDFVQMMKEYNLLDHE
ncbi:MAG: PqqD family protein [Bacteroidales bacterium]|nr:PqqD family protein [Bacteroidales bacterium]